MEDLFNSIKAYLYDGTSSPLFGAFFVSWLIWNYKAVLVIFSSNPLIVKLDYFSDTLYPISTSFSFTHPIFILIIYPTVTAIAYIYLYPIPAKHIYRYSRNAQRELREVKQEIENETPLTIEESRKIRRDIAEIEFEFEDELKSKNEQILSLLVDADKDRNELAHKSAKLDEKELDLSRRGYLLPVNLDELKENEKFGYSVGSEAIIPITKGGELSLKNVAEYNKDPLTIGKRQLELLHQIVTRQLIGESDLINSSSRSPAEITADIEFLLSHDLIKQQGHPDEPDYSITPKGKDAAKNSQVSD
jgi:predicted transcriptional regulator